MEKIHQFHMLKKKQVTIESLISMPARLSVNSVNVQKFDITNPSSRATIKTIIDNMLNDKNSKNLDFSELASDVTNELYNTSAVAEALSQLHNDSESTENFDHQLQSTVDDMLRLALRTRTSLLKNKI